MSGFSRTTCFRKRANRMPGRPYLASLLRHRHRGAKAMYAKILAGYDGSEAGRKAFETALELAATHGAELYVLAVCRPPEIGDDVETEAVIENSRRHHRGLLAELKPAVSAKRVKAHFEVAVG